MNNMPPFDPKFIEEMKKQNDFMMEFAEKQRQADNKVGTIKIWGDRGTKPFQKSGGDPYQILGGLPYQNLRG